MVAIPTSPIRLQWKGQWRSRTQYFKNDVCVWKGKSYKCIRDLPMEFVIKTTGMVNSNNSSFEIPTLIRRSFRPDNQRYWVLFIRSVDRVKLWNWAQQYFPGEMVRVKGAVYLCTTTTRNKNTYVTETAYWTQVYQSPRRAKYRHEAIMFNNSAPLGWRYNMGENCWAKGDMQYKSQVICSDGTVQNFGGQDVLGRSGTGANGIATSTGLGKHQQTAFTFVDWLTSTDNASWNTQDQTGKLPTPDGKCPKVIQIAAGYQTSLYLMNNGEVYSAGYNGQGNLGVGDTTDRYFTSRVTATDTTDWLGNTITNTFNQTKMVKVGVSSQQQTGGNSACFALGEDGSVWVWGYNNQGQLGLGNPTINAVIDQSGWYSTNLTRPRRLPQEYFDGKAIIDMWNVGCGQTRWYAIDEEGMMWTWGKNQYGELGQGHGAGTYFAYTPSLISVDFRMYGGIKKFMVTSNDEGVTTAYILDHEGWLWSCGYATSGSVPGVGAEGATDSIQWGSFRRLDFFMNGDIDEFWVGGDTGQWCVIRQKNSDMVWSYNGNYAAGARGSGVRQGSWYNSGGQANVFTFIEGPKGCKFVTGHNKSRIDATYQYSDPVIFDDDGIMWAGGRNIFGYQSQGFDPGANTSGNNNRWTDSGPNSPDQDLNDNEFNYERKRKFFIPSGTSIVDCHAFGFGANPLMAFRDENGKILWDGYDGGNQQTLNYSRYPYSATTTGHRYMMHSGPTD